VWLTERVLFCAGIGVVVKMFLGGGWNPRRIEVRISGLNRCLFRLLAGGRGCSVLLLFSTKTQSSTNIHVIQWPLLALSAFLNFVRIASFCAVLPRMGALRSVRLLYPSKQINHVKQTDC
jgi:hypothetical protein